MIGEQNGTESFRVLLNRTDEAFGPEESVHCGLGIVVGTSELSVSVTDLRRGRNISLLLLRNSQESENESVTYGNQRDSSFPEVVFQRLPILRFPFQHIRLVVDLPVITMIPDQLYDPSANRIYLENVFGDLPAGTYLADSVKPAGAHVLYHLPATFADLLSRYFPGAALFHYGSVFMASVYQYYRSRGSDPRVFLNLRFGRMDILVLDGQKLLFYNLFNQNTPEEVAYFLIFVMEQLNLDPEQVPVVLFGDEARIGLVQPLLYKYVRHVDPTGWAPSQKFIRDTGTVEPSALFTLLNIFSCGL